jgi:DNA-binding CsgD family transcriptional regulator
MQGKTNEEIAIILQVSPRTVEKHLEHILVQLGVENRTAAALAAAAVSSRSVRT